MFNISAWTRSESMWKHGTIPACTHGSVQLPAAEGDCSPAGMALPEEDCSLPGDLSSPRAPERSSVSRRWPRMHTAWLAGYSQCAGGLGAHAGTKRFLPTCLYQLWSGAKQWLHTAQLIVTKPMYLCIHLSLSSIRMSLMAHAHQDKARLCGAAENYHWLQGV